VGSVMRINPESAEPCGCSEFVPELCYPCFRHPQASRAFGAQTGGASGLRERDTVQRGGLAFGVCVTDSRSRALLGPPVALRLPEDDERKSAVSRR